MNMIQSCTHTAGNSDFKKFTFAICNQGRKKHLFNMIYLAMCSILHTEPRLTNSVLKLKQYVEEWEVSLARDD